MPKRHIDTALAAVSGEQSEDTPKGINDNDNHANDDATAADTQYCTDIHQIRKAAASIAPYIHRTPLLTSTILDNMYSGRTKPRSKSKSKAKADDASSPDDAEVFDGHLFFKCELFQKTGSFKVRGAMNAVMALSDEEAANGVRVESKCPNSFV